jgi:serine/threonine protein kinase
MNSDPNNALSLIKEEIAIMKKLDHHNLVSLIEVLDDPQEDSHVIHSLVQSVGSLSGSWEHSPKIGGVIFDVGNPNDLRASPSSWSSLDRRLEFRRVEVFEQMVSIQRGHA